MSEDAKAVVRRLYEQVSAGNLDALAEALDDDFLDHEETPGFSNDREGVVAFFRAMREAFPDLRVEVHDMAGEGEKVWARVTFQGTHRGEFLGVPASGNPVAFQLVDILRLRGGKVAEHWGVSDTLTLMQQMGAIPESAPGSG